MGRNGVSEEKDSGEWGGFLSTNPSEMNINILTIPFYAVLAADMPWNYSLINSTIGGEGRLMSSAVDNSLDDQRYMSYDKYRIGVVDHYYRSLSFSLRWYILREKATSAIIEEAHRNMGKSRKVLGD